MNLQGKYLLYFENYQWEYILPIMTLQKWIGDILQKI